MARIAFLFSGQGAQYPGMMKELYDSEASIRAVYDCAGTVLARSISKLSFKGTQEELNLTHNTQPCVLAADIAAGRALQAHGVEPSAVAGFSLGEYAALEYARVLSLDETFRLIQIRADAMQTAVAPGEGAMAAFVGASTDQVENICKAVTVGYVVAANYNSPVQTVISGTVTGVDEACAMAYAQGIRTVKLAVSAPFHCALMKPAAMKLKDEFGAVAFSNPKIPVYMNVDGTAITIGADIDEKLVQQAMSPVRWVRTLQNMQADGIDTFIECGPGRTLSGLVKKTLNDVTILRVENIKTLNDTLEVIIG